MSPEPRIEKTEMVNLTIDGIEVSAPKGTLVIRAAEQIGVQIPRFCDHPLLAPVGACRQCLVEVAMPGPDGQPAGRYHALDPETYYWAHATFVEQIYYFADTFVN